MCHVIAMLVAKRPEWSELCNGRVLVHPPMNEAFPWAGCMCDATWIRLGAPAIR